MPTRVCATADALNAKQEPQFMSPTSNTQAPVTLGTAATRRRHPRLPRLGLTGWIGCVILLGWLVAAIFGPLLINPDAAASGELQVFAPVSAQHWLGTDYMGRDMLARVLLGARYTVCLALVSTLCASGIGITLALLATVSGRWIDACLSRGLDTLTAIPSKMFALIMVAAFGSSVWMLTITAAIIYVPGAYRIARSLAVNINAMDYVTVARTRGEGTAYIMRQEILPNIVGPMLADLGLRFVYVVLLLASLSFLGLGIQPPEADWGSLVRENIGALSEGSMAVVAPALAIASLTMAVNLVIDNLPGRSARGRK
ncbi:Dipeptide transport system permease protein DppC [Cupriavidus taiwanensis]|nr:Dipeptide transport system permease protein DppC [Cupriavidus taiwanensis]SPA21851.1 Dipeptide transport system permease protein DppC [Cupriavidus taiwanensis]